MVKKFLASFLLVLFSLTGFSPPQDDQEINRKIRQINSKLEELDQTKDSILDQIYNIELQYEKHIIVRNNLERKIRRIKQGIGELENRQNHLTGQIENFREDIKKVLRILYKTGGNTTLKLFLRIDDLNQLFENYHLFITLVGFKSEEISAARKAITELIEVKSRLQQQRERLKVNVDTQTREIGQLQKIRESRVALLQQINNDKRTYIRHLNELKLQAERLDDMIIRRKNTFKTLEIELTPLRKNIRWPLQGKVISTYGRKKSKKFDTYTMNNGIEIAPGDSDSIQSILPGVVVYADYFKGYGNTVIIQHSANLFSLYGRCRKLYVQTGQRVEEGELIGLVGDSGSLRGPALYFEIRVDIQARNPLDWLR